MENYGKRSPNFHKDTEKPKRRMEKNLFQKTNFSHKFNHRLGRKQDFR